MRDFERRSNIQRLSMRFADGAGGESAEQIEGAAAQPAAAVPASTPAEGTAKTYSDADLESAKSQAVADYKQHLEEAKDYEKMTPEEKVSYLEAQREADKLTQLTTNKLAAQNMPIELLPFVQGKDETEIDAVIKALGGIIDKAAQAGVEKRFKENGYLPKGSAVTGTADSGQKRERGVKVQ